MWYKCEDEWFGQKVKSLDSMCCNFKFCETNVFNLYVFKIDSWFLKNKMRNSKNQTWYDFGHLFSITAITRTILTQQDCQKCESEKK